MVRTGGDRPPRHGVTTLSPTFRNSALAAVTVTTLLATGALSSVAAASVLGGSSVPTGSAGPVGSAAMPAAASGPGAAAPRPGDLDLRQHIVTRADAAEALVALATAVLGPLTGEALADVAADSPAGMLHALGVVHGRADSSFGPDVALTRGQLASVAARLLAAIRGEPLLGGEAPFGDVAGDPHAGGIAAAARDGLVLGRTDGTFGAREFATRPQLHAVVSRLREVLSSEGLIPGGDPLPDPVIAHFDTPEGSFSAVIDDPRSINRIYGAELGTHIGIPNGRILPGDGGVNHGHDWHLVDVELVDMTMELCDGTAAYIDRVGLDAWYETQGDRYCAWSAVLTGWGPAPH